MESFPQKNNRPFKQAAVVFALLVCVVISIAIFVDFSGTDLVVLLFIVGTLCCVLVAKNVYDMAVLEQQSKIIKKSTLVVTAKVK